MRKFKEISYKTVSFKPFFTKMKNFNEILDKFRFSDLLRDFQMIIIIFLQFVEQIGIREFKQ